MSMLCIADFSVLTLLTFLKKICNSFYTILQSII